MESFGFRVESFGFGVERFGFRVHGVPSQRPSRQGCRSRAAELACGGSGFGFRVSGFGSRFSGFGIRVSGFEFRVSGFRFRVSDLGSRVSGFGFRVSGFGFHVRVSGLTKVDSAATSLLIWLGHESPVHAGDCPDLGLQVFRCLS